MSAQLICKVIRILETLISIILMNFDGRLFFCFFQRRRRKEIYRICGLLGNFEARVGEGGGLLWDSLTFGVSGVIQS